MTYEVREMVAAVRRLLDSLDEEARINQKYGEALRTGIDADRVLPEMMDAAAATRKLRKDVDSTMAAVEFQDDWQPARRTA